MSTVVVFVPVFPPTLHRSSLAVRTGPNCQRRVPRAVDPPHGGRPEPTRYGRVVVGVSSDMLVKSKLFRAQREGGGDVVGRYAAHGQRKRGDGAEEALHRAASV